MKMRVLTMILIVALLSCACAEEKNWDEFQYEEPVTVSMLLSTSHNQEAFGVAAKLIEERLNIHTEFQLRSSDIEGEDFLKSLLTMGEMTDLCVYNSGALLKSLNPRVYFVDLTNETFASKISETFAEAVSSNGRLYGVPAGTSYAGGWLYNISLHEELGLEIPKTWGQLMANCENIKQRGYIPIVGGYEDNWVTQMVLLADHHNLIHDFPTWIEAYNSGTATYSNTTAALKGFQKLYELSSRHLYQDDAANTSYEEACRMFAEGKAVYMPMLTSAISVMDGLVPGSAENIGIFGQPGSDKDYQGITLWLPSGIYISNTSENIEAAKLWLEFFLSDECQEVFQQYKKPSGISVIKNSKPVQPVYPYLEMLLEYQKNGNAVLAAEFTSPLKGSHLTQITQECALGLITPSVAAHRYDQDTKNLSLLMRMFDSIE